MRVSRIQYALSSLEGSAIGMQYRLDAGEKLSMFHVENLEKTLEALRQFVEEQESE